MVGFNVPTFKLLDVLSLEVEYYGCEYRNDYQNLHENYAPIPVSTDSTFNSKEDDWKWSIYAARSIGSHLKFSTQFASDHMRLSTGWNLAYPEALTTLRDWYWIAKMTYFF